MVLNAKDVKELDKGELGKDTVIYLFLNYNRTPFIRKLVIRIGLALQVTNFLLQIYYIFLWFKSQPFVQKYKKLCIDISFVHK